MAKAQALLFGVNEVDPAGYDNKWDGKLSFCEKDATLVANFVEQRGFETTLLLTSQVTKQRMIDETSKAAATLEQGDLFLFYFSGHGNTTADITGDEIGRTNMRDETLCVYDNQILDDELYTLWQNFKPGVRILVLTDACHSGAVLRGSEDHLVSKAVPERTSKIIKRKDKDKYMKMRNELPEAKPLQCSIIHLAGCREDQLSYENKRMKHGQFTGFMLATIEAGNLGSYKKLFDAMNAAMPDNQKPVMNKLGVEQEKFNTEPAFSID